MPVTVASYSSRLAQNLGNLKVDTPHSCEGCILYFHWMQQSQGRGVSTLKRPSLFKVCRRCFLGRFELNNNFFHSLFTVVPAPMDSRSELEPVFGSSKSRKLRGPGHAIRLVIHGAINAPSTALGTGESSF